MTARKYKKLKPSFVLLKYVIIIENIIRQLVKKVLFQQKLRQKSVMEQPRSTVSTEECKDTPRLFSKWSQSKQHVDLITFTLTIQRATLPSVILGDAHAYASMCVPGADSEILKKGGPLCPPP